MVDPMYRELKKRKRMPKALKIGLILLTTFTVDAVLAIWLDTLKFMTSPAFCALLFFSALFTAIAGIVVALTAFMGDL